MIRLCALYLVAWMHSDGLSKPLQKAVSDKDLAIGLELVLWQNVIKHPARCR